ncbi:hypothetical protein [Allofournierella massiliensis]|uniref:hypothetical protein n=1 Tax=Allofournierella massiliensis TaxID=1650663 RepID=UPI0035670589
MEGFHSGAPNLCRVCVDAWAGGEVTGRLYHCYSRQPEPIGRISDVLDSIDRLCDRLNYPARTQQPRHFGPEKPRPQTTQKKVEPQMTREELAKNKGKMATFVVHVMYRQHSTWQGSVTWAETGEKANFRSALELIKLMDSAVEATLGDESPLQEKPDFAHPTNPVREETDYEA